MKSNAEESPEKPLVTALVPILYVRDLRTERDFYAKLGFKVTTRARSILTLLRSGTESSSSA
jgi:hypothetical protein